MKKLYSTIMLLAMMVAALSLSACGGDDEDDDFGVGGSSSSSTLKMVSSKGEEYHLLDRYNEHFYGNLSTRGHIWCFMENERGNSIGYFRIKLGSVKTIADFPVGLDLGEVDMNFATQGDYNHYNEFDYASGSIKVIANDGKSFTLRFYNYIAERSSGWTMTVNGTLYVEDEKSY